MSDQEPTHRLTRGEMAYRDADGRRKKVSAGQVIPVPLGEAAQEAFADRIEPLDAGEDVSAEDADAEAETTGDLGDLTVAQLRSRLEDLEIEEADIEGTGANGNVVKADLVRAIEDAQE